MSQERPTSSLFRSEAVKHQNASVFGTVQLIRPASLWTTTLVLCLTIAVGGAFLGAATYARSERTIGYLNPSGGALSLHAPRRGRIRNISFSQGAMVEKGAALLIIENEERTNAMQALADLQRRRLKSRIDAIEKQKEAERHRFAALLARMERTAAGYRTALALARHDRENRHALVDLTRNSFETAKRLAARGHLTRIERDVRQLRYREAISALHAAERHVEELQTNLAQLHEERTMAHAESLALLARLQESEEQLRGRLDEIATRHHLLITAPRSGRIGALLVHEGMSVAPGQALLTILPKDGRLEAILVIPTRAAGLVRSGAAVRIFYSAFPYQRFGIHRATVVEITDSIIRADEIPLPVVTREPFYLARAKLEHQTILAFGKRRPLRAGMLLEAEIVLERRPLLIWLFDPLRALREHWGDGGMSMKASIARREAMLGASSPDPDTTSIDTATFPITTTQGEAG